MNRWVHLGLTFNAPEKQFKIILNDNNDAYDIVKVDSSLTVNHVKLHFRIGGFLVKDDDSKCSLPSLLEDTFRGSIGEVYFFDDNASTNWLRKAYTSPREEIKELTHAIVKMEDFRQSINGITVKPSFYEKNKRNDAM